MKYLTEVKSPYVLLTTGKAVRSKLKQNSILCEKALCPTARTFPNVNSFKQKFSILLIK